MGGSRLAVDSRSEPLPRPALRATRPTKLKCAGPCSSPDSTTKAGPRHSLILLAWMDPAQLQVSSILSSKSLTTTTGLRLILLTHISALTSAHDAKCNRRSAIPRTRRAKFANEMQWPWVTCGRRSDHDSSKLSGRQCPGPAPNARLTSSSVARASTRYTAPRR